MSQPPIAYLNPPLRRTVPAHCWISIETPRSARDPVVSIPAISGSPDQTDALLIEQEGGSAGTMHSSERTTIRFKGLDGGEPLALTRPQEQDIGAPLFDPVLAVGPETYLLLEWTSGGGAPRATASLVGPSGGSSRGGGTVDVGYFASGAMLGGSPRRPAAVEHRSSRSRQVAM